MAGAASCIISGHPSGLELASSVSYSLGQPGLPHPTHRIPSLKGKVRVELSVDPRTRSWRAMLGPELPAWVLGAMPGSEPVCVLEPQLVSEP